MEKISGEIFKKRLDFLKQEAASHHEQWKQIAMFMRPLRQEFRDVFLKGKMPAEHYPLVTDSSAHVALENFSSGLYGYLTNPAVPWVRVQAADPGLNKFYRTKEWFDQANLIMRKSLTEGVSDFYSQVPDNHADTAAFGVGPFMSEYIPSRSLTGKKFNDRSISPFSIYWDENEFGELNAIYRPFLLSGRQAKSMFPDGYFTRAREKRIKADADEQFEVLHVIHPNDQFLPGKFGDRGKRFVDIYMDSDEGYLIQKRGRKTMTYYMAKWATGKYSPGLGIRNLPDIKSINAMMAAQLKSAEWQNEPALLKTDDDALSRQHPIPGKAIVNGINSYNGKANMQFMQPSGNLNITQEMMQSKIEAVRDAFYFTLMQLANRSGMTATEVLERSEERMRLQGPHLARTTSTFLSPFIQDRFALHLDNGLFPPMPEELADAELLVEYESPMVSAHKANQAQNVIRLMEGTATITALDPDAADHIDGDALVDVLIDGFNLPSNVRRDPELVKKMRQDRAAAQEAAAQMEQASQASQIASQLSTAAANEEA